MRRASVPGMSNETIMNHVNATETAATNTRAHVEGLLRAYPDVTAEELAHLLNFLAKGAILDIGHIKGDPELNPIVERVKREHPEPFTVGMGRHVLHWTLMIVPILAFCWYAWDAGVY